MEAKKSNPRLRTSIIAASLLIVSMSMPVVPAVDAVTSVSNIAKALVQNGAVDLNWGSEYESDPYVICGDEGAVIHMGWRVEESRPFALGQVRAVELALTLTPQTSSIADQTEYSSSEKLLLTEPGIHQSKDHSNPRLVLPAATTPTLYTLTAKGIFWENALMAPEANVWLDKTVLITPCIVVPEELLNCLTANVGDCGPVGELTRCPNQPDPINIGGGGLGWQNGISDWVLAGAVSICGGTFYTPGVPMYADIGALDGEPYNISPPSNTQCEFENNFLAPDAWKFNFTRTVSLASTAWAGWLPFFAGSSAVGFEIPSKSHNITKTGYYSGAETNDADYVLCSGMIEKAIGESYVEGMAWVNTQLSSKAVPCQAQVTYLNGLLTTGHMSGICHITVDVFTRAYRWDGEWVVVNIGMHNLVVKGEGHSAFIGAMAELENEITGRQVI